MKLVATWYIAAVAVALVGSAVVIFGFDYYEPGFGRAYSMQLASLFGLSFAIVGAIAYAAANFARRTTPTTLQAFIAGAVFQSLLFAAIEGSKRFAPQFNSLVSAAVMAALLGVASSFMVGRHVA
jgi:xanthine/uracil permease